ncbi:MAG TPA: type II secretion system protein GspH [Rhodopseudomonas sp.]|uniref:type II secretion system protein GspH n=1 Tax=Rhodopseudomonas sp. TaxID=1078 RepID=UPI002EDB162F
MSRVGSPPIAANAGYILLELLAALALTGLLMALAFPALPPGTSRSQLQALSVSAANLLRDARTAASNSGHDERATFDRLRRTLGSATRLLSVPQDVEVGLLAGARCNAEAGRIGIVFRADGTNCGGVFRFALRDRAMRVRVNWLTGHVEILQDQR